MPQRYRSHLVLLLATVTTGTSLLATGPATASPPAGHATLAPVVAQSSDVMAQSSGGDADRSVHFTAVGDYGATADTRAVLTTMAGLDPDLNLALGDMSYGAAGAEQAWCDMVKRHVGESFPFQLLAGNHESNGLNGNINDFSACLPNQLPGLVGTYGRQWYVDVPAHDPLVRFVMISPGIAFRDGTWSYAAGTPRHTWTAAAIDGAREAAIPWVVVGMHAPCLSVGKYTCQPGADVLNLLLEKRVDLVLSGHEHNYQRTGQLALSEACPAMVPGVADLDCLVDADRELLRGAGTVFATVGTGGRPLRDVNTADPEAPYFAAMSGLANATSGLLDVRVTAGSLSASFERAAGGTFTDSFTMGPVVPETPAGPGKPLASDTFSRDVTAGLGAADVGGDWVLTGDPAVYRVAAGAAAITVRPGAAPDASLPSLTSTATDLTYGVTLDRRPGGWGLYLSTVGRRVGSDDYRARVRVRPDGNVQLGLDRVSGSAGTVLAPWTTVPGLTVAGGQELRVRTQVVGTDPTTLRAKVWRADGMEPAEWQVSRTDSTATLQAPGSVALNPYLSKYAGTPVTVRVDDLLTSELSD